MVAFPGRQEMLTYMNNHPGHNIVLQNPQLTKNFPGATEKVAAFFANKKMVQNEILDNVSAILWGPEKWKEEKQSRQLFNDLITGLEKTSDTYYIEQAKTWKSIRMEAEAGNTLFNVTANMYCEILKDLLDKATFTPPGPGENKWKKHIPVVNLTNNQ